MRTNFYTPWDVMQNTIGAVVGNSQVLNIRLGPLRPQLEGVH